MTCWGFSPIYNSEVCLWPRSLSQWQQLDQTWMKFPRWESSIETKACLHLYSSNFTIRLKISPLLSWRLQGSACHLFQVSAAVNISHFLFFLCSFFWPHFPLSPPLTFVFVLWKSWCITNQPGVCCSLSCTISNQESQGGDLSLKWITCSEGGCSLELVVTPQ